MARCFSGQRLREVRTAAGMVPERLALDVERSAYSIHDYERGRVSPPSKVVAALADALGVNPGDLFDEVPGSAT